MSRITYDADPRDAESHPRAGDFLESSRTRYFVLASRRVRSRVAPARFALEVESTLDAPGTPVGPRRRVLPLVWYPRGRKRPA